MPSRAQRRAMANDHEGDKCLKVTDANGLPYEIWMSDVSAKDEYDFTQQTQGLAGGLCDIFIKGVPTLVGIAGLIWTARRKFEKKLSIHEVMDDVNMMTLETIDLFDPADADDDQDDESGNDGRPEVFDAPYAGDSPS